MDDKSFGEVTMAHVVIVTSQTAGRVQVAVELARRLGKRVTRRLSSLVRSTVRANRRPRREIPTPRSDCRLRWEVSLDSRKPGDRDTARLGELRSARERMAEKVDAMELDRDHATISDLGPDLVLVDVEIPAVVMSAVGAGRSVAVWTTMLSVWKRPGLPPLGSATVPGSSIAGSRLGMELEWLRFRAGKRMKALRHRVARTGLDQMSQMRENRSQDWLLAQGDFAQSMACSIRLSELAHADLHRSGA